MSLNDFSVARAPSVRNFSCGPTCNIFQKNNHNQSLAQARTKFRALSPLSLAKAQAHTAHIQTPTNTQPAALSICSLIVASMRFKSEAFCYPKKASDAVLRDGVTCVTDGQLSQAQRATRFAMQIVPHRPQCKFTIRFRSSTHAHSLTLAFPLSCIFLARCPL